MKPEPDTAAVHRLDFLIDNGLDQLVLWLVGGDGVEIVGGLHLGLDHLLGFRFLLNLSDGILVDGYFRGALLGFLTDTG